LQQLAAAGKVAVTRLSEGFTAMALVDVKTEITGNVWKIVAKVGEKLDEDAPILILESMKMEIPVSAPEAGTLREILVEEGQVVAEGTVVARLEA
jgi:acetyl-CoA carboxylase biotin carboxyl carrier protein